MLVDRRARLIGFATSPRRRTQQKFLSILLDELETLLDPRVIVPLLPGSTWDGPAYLFCAPREFGTPVLSFDRALEGPAGPRGRLVITRDGVAGCLDTGWCGRILVIGREANRTGSHDFLRHDLD